MNPNNKGEVVTFASYEPDTDYYVISCIKRHPETNLLFIGTHKHVVIVFWNKADLSFTTISQVETSSEQPVIDMVYNNHILYTVSDDGRGTVIHFGDHLYKNRDPKLNNSKVASYFNKISENTRKPDEHTELMRSKILEMMAITIETKGKLLSKTAGDIGGANNSKKKAHTDSSHESDDENDISRG